ncbi:MAG: sialidase family protein [Actinomycetota bacterium]
MHRRTVVAIGAFVTLALAFAVIAAHTSTPPRSRARAGASGEPATEGDGAARGGSTEQAEQAATTQERLDALAAARSDGTFGTAATVTGTPAPGWAGEQLFNAGTDDWEPAIAADPHASWVYALVTRYGTGKACQGNCPTPYMVLERSHDGGATWSKGTPLCACKGSGQFDPLIEVVPDTGDVYAAYMNGYNVVFLRSSDHGRTWTGPIATWGNVSWGDKPAMAMSDSGRDVYISFNGPQGGDAWVAQSHDYGDTWTQSKVAKSKDDYFFAYDADVLHDGTIVFAESGVIYGGGGDNVAGPTTVHAFVSTDRGTTWHDVVLDSVPAGEACADCRADYYVGQMTVTADDRGHLVFVYNAPTTDHGPQQMWVRRSNDDGLTWSSRTSVSVPGENTDSPAAEATGNGDVRLVYMQTANGDNSDQWNVWYRRSTDAGRTWSAPVKISDMATGATYKTAQGFGEPYGDYEEIGITNEGTTIGIWGEGPNYVGPGGCWFNRQL